jgi:hypothetical protein
MEISRSPAIAEEDSDGNSGASDDDTIVYDLEGHDYFPYPNRELAELCSLLSSLNLSVRETQKLLKFLKRPLDFERVPSTIGSVQYVKNMLPMIPVQELKLSQVL